MGIATSPSTEYVIRIHGTGASRPEDAGTAWWQSGNDFQEVLEGRLADRARFFPRSFRWSGNNSERERRAAGIILLEDWLIPLEARRQPYHLIGHSHGGSVIWAALMEAERRRRPLENLRSWTTVGTPFLHYRPDPVKGWLGLICLAFIVVHSLIEGLVVAGGGAGGIQSAVKKALSSTPVTIALATMDLIAWVAFPLWCLSYLLLLLGHRLDRSRARRAFERYRGRWLGIYSANDEAIQGLRATLSLDGEILLRAPTLVSALEKMVRDRRRLPPSVMASEKPLESETHVSAFAKPFRALLAASGHRPGPGDLLLPVWALILAYSSIALFGSTDIPSEAAILVLLGLGIACGFGSVVYALRSVLALASLLDRRTGRRGVDADPKTWVESGRSLQSSPILTRLTINRFLSLPFREVLGWVHNGLIAPVVDRFIWIRIRNKAQGNDLKGRILFDVGESPMPMESGVPIGRGVDAMIAARADEQASRAISRFRSRLGSIVLLGTGIGKVEGAAGDPDLITWKELIHNTYFDHDPIRELIASRILCDGDREAPAVAPPRRQAARTRLGIGMAVRLLLVLMSLAVSLPLFIWVVVYVYQELQKPWFHMG